MTENFDVIDEQDNVIEARPGRECIRLGLLHRAIVIFLYNLRSELYIQKRSNAKEYFPGLWSASCTGHVSSGETYFQAARREAKEELSLDLKLNEVCRFISPKWKVSNGVEWESIAVFEAVAEDPHIVLSDESQEGRFVSVDEFRRLLGSEPSTLTPDTILSAQYSPRLK
jgi:isopentenyl-diphosphate delta-isomerase